MSEPTIIRAEELKEEDYGSTKVQDILKTEAFSIAKVRKTGDDVQLGYDTESNVAYYVLEGEGTAVIEGKEHLLKKGDCVYYSKGMKYKHLKGLTLLAIASPPFDREKRAYVE